MIIPLSLISSVSFGVGYSSAPVLFSDVLLSVDGEEGGSGTLFLNAILEFAIGMAISPKIRIMILR